MRIAVTDRVNIIPVRITEGQKGKFLASLMLGNSVTKACQDAGVPRRTVYYFRSEDESFKDAWDDAIAASVEELEDHLRKRATNPDDKNAHILLMFLLKKLNPEYRENYKAPEKKATVKSQEFEFTSEELDLAMGILSVAKAAKPPAGIE